MSSAVMTLNDWQRYEPLVPSLRQVGHRCRGAVPKRQPHSGFCAVVSVAELPAYLSRQGLPLVDATSKRSHI